jgi:hypothetical protein
MNNTFVPPYSVGGQGQTVCRYQESRGLVDFALQYNGTYLVSSIISTDGIHTGLSSCTCAQDAAKHTGMPVTFCTTGCKATVDKVGWTRDGREIFHPRDIA